MILGIGTDMVDIARIRRVFEEHGERFIDRCFDGSERAYVEKKSAGKPDAVIAGYAKRWAAKEACAKALGLGIREHIFLKDIIVTNDTDGKPAITLQNGAKERLTHITPAGMTPAIDISLTDEPPMAMAFVVISAIVPQQGT